MDRSVLVGMSGGVDSSVAAALLKEAGWNPIGITLNVWPEGPGITVVEREDACCALGAVEDARRVCARLDIPHYVVNFRDVFQRQVIDNFVDEYRNGRTPNPCVRCNQFIKFDALLAKAQAFGAEFVATGHYARTTQLSNGRWALRKAVDLNKDQSYVLHVMTQERLARTVFPLGELTKEQVRDRAVDLGLHVAGKPESQEICFVPTRDYRDYLRDQHPEVAQPGPIVDSSGAKLGEHQGVAFFTVGQRRGLGVPSAEPLFVNEIRATGNTIVVGSPQSLMRSSAKVSSVNWMAIERLEGPIRVAVKARYKAAEVEATITPDGQGRVNVQFDAPQRALSPGQSAVFYQDEVVIGGGTIEEPSSPRPSRPAPGAEWAAQ